MAGKRHVILGSGTAGLNAIRTLRQLGDDGPIVLVSAEAPYSRMVLPYYLARRITEPHVTTATGRQLDEWGVERQIGRRAEGLDTKAAKLRLDNGEDVAYDDLLIATGSSALTPPIPGAEHARCFNFWTLDDAKGVNKTISPDAHVVMVGAGFISFTILNGILERAGRLTIVELAPRILPRMIDDAGAAMVTDWLIERGVTIRAGAEITGIAERGQGLRLTFAEGDSIDADLVLTLDRETEREAKALRLNPPVEMLGDYVGTGEEVEDPYGRSRRHYRDVALQLKRLVELLVARLDSGAVSTPEP